MSNPIIPGYDPNDFVNYDSISEIRKRLNSLDPLTDSVFELAHLNREAARLVRKPGLVNHPKKRIILDRLFHTCNKDIKIAATYSGNAERINSFKEGVKHTLLNIMTL